MLNSLTPWFPVITALISLSAAWVGLWFGSRLNSAANRAAKLLEIRIASYRELAGLLTDVETEYDNLRTALVSEDVESREKAKERLNELLSKFLRRINEDMLIFSDKVGASFVQATPQFRHPEGLSAESVANSIAQIRRLREAIHSAGRDEIARVHGKRIWG